MGETKTKNKKGVVLVAAVVVLVLLGYYLWQNGISLGLPGSGGDYQAVFLSNGQVYFGKASRLSSNYVDLRDVYYLQVNRVLQPLREGEAPVEQQAVSLAKLGVNELHRPKDLMKINRAHILFIESLESESAVVQAIETHKESLKDADDEEDEG